MYKSVLFLIYFKLFRNELSIMISADNLDMIIIYSYIILWLDWVIHTETNDIYIKFSFLVFINFYYTYVFPGN